VAVEAGVEQDIEADNRSAGDLQDHLPAGAEPLAVVPADLAVIIDGADQTEEQRDKLEQPDQARIQPGPEQGREGDRNQDQQTAHRRYPLLGEMGHGAVVPDHLPDLQALHRPDEGRAENIHDQKRRDGAADAPEGDVAEDIETDKGGVEGV